MKLTKGEATKLSEVWNLIYKAYNKMEDLRPGGGFDSFVEREDLKRKPATMEEMKQAMKEVFPSFHISDVPGQTPIQKMKHIMRSDTKPINLTTIQKDYEQYGYLEDYQVEWLMDRLQQITECVDNAYRFGNGNMIDEIERVLTNKESDESET